MRMVWDGFTLRGLVIAVVSLVFSLGWMARSVVYLGAGTPVTGTFQTADLDHDGHEETVLEYAFAGRTYQFANGAKAPGTSVRLVVLPGSPESWAFAEPVAMFGWPTFGLVVGSGILTMIVRRNRDR